MTAKISLATLGKLKRGQSVIISNLHAGRMYAFIIVDGKMYFGEEHSYIMSKEFPNDYADLMEARKGRDSDQKFCAGHIVDNNALLDSVTIFGYTVSDVTEIIANEGFQVFLQNPNNKRLVKRIW